MNIQRSLRSLTAAIALAVASGAACASPEAWQQADAEYQAQRYANALALYEQIASTGDARAAELAGHMLALGEQLYGDAIRRDPERAMRLLAQAAKAGRPVAAHLLQRVTLASAAPLAAR